MHRLLILNHLANNTLTLDDFDKKDNFTDNIISNMTEENLISQGATGKIFLIDDKIVVKQIKPCETRKDSALQRYCVDMNKLYDTDIVGIAGGNGKYRYILPNLLSEIAIGLILGDLDLAFANTITSMIVREEIEGKKKEENIAIYIAMDKLNPVVINNELTINLNHIQLVTMLFQISQGLLAAQQEYQFTHYDLHIENLLYKEWDENKYYISYPLPNQNMKMMIMKEYCPYIFKIADFALARIETAETILSSTIDDYPVRTYSEFNPSYDFASLLGSILISTKHLGTFQKLYSNINTYRFILQLTLWFYKETIDISNMNKQELDKVRIYLGDKYYKKFKTKYFFRPRQDEDFIPYMNTRSMVDVVNYIAAILIKTKYVKVHQNTPNVIVVKDLGYYQQYDSVMIYNQLDDPIPILPFVEVYKTRLNIKLEPQRYNYTLEKQQLENCPIQKQFMTVIKVNKGYEKYGQFFYDCCKLDAPNYLVKNQKLGFVVNGGFFSIKKDYLPIGPYKDKYNYINAYEIPKKYKHLYAYIILKNNKLSISKDLKLNDQVCSSGPLLIDNGKIVIDLNNKIYQCTDKKHAGDLFISETDNTITVSGHYEYINKDDHCDVKVVKQKKTLKRCDKILPGELSHASNPNPRTILCFTKTGYLFIVFDGRSLYGDGVDLLTAAKIILKKFPDVISAINLDGGRSSVAAWRSNIDEHIVYNNSNFRNYYYPAGYVIGLLSR